MNIYTNKFHSQEFEKIEDFFKILKVDFSDLQYGRWRAIGKDFNACLYNTGKFVIQGKDVSVIAQNFEKYMIERYNW